MSQVFEIIKNYFDASQHPNWSSLLIQVSSGLIIGIISGFFYGRKYEKKSIKIVGDSLINSKKESSEQKSGTGSKQNLAKDGSSVFDQDNCQNIGTQNIYPTGISPKIPGELSENRRQICKKVRDITNNEIDFEPLYDDIRGALNDDNDHLIATNTYRAYKNVVYYVSENSNENTKEFASNFQVAVESLRSMMNNPDACGNSKQELKKCEQMICIIHAEIF